MNILLMNSPAPRYSPFSVLEKRPPLGIGFLISMLRRKGHKVYFIDNYIKPSFDEEFLVNRNIDYVGMYLDTICFLEGQKILSTLERMRKEARWKGKIMVGGPHPSVMPETIPDYVDYVVRGEGERAILEILSGGKERIVQEEFITDLDSLPPPAWDCFVGWAYDFSCDFFPEEPVFTHNTSRGCPFNCSFCSVGSIWGRTYRSFTASRIVDDIRLLIDKYGARGIYFREDNFVCDKKRTYNFCELLLKKDIKISWACETRIDNLDEDLLRLMNKAGCRGIYIGVESGNQRILDFLNKGITLGQIKEIFSYCKEIGIKTYASFIVGAPTETDRELLDTIKFSEEIQPSMRGFNIFVGIPYSKLYDYIEKNDLYGLKDKSGILYTKRHNFLTEQLLASPPCAEVPQDQENVYRKRIFDKKSLTEKEKKIVSKFFFIQAGASLLQSHKGEAWRLSLASLRYSLINWRAYIVMCMTVLPFKMIGIVRKMQRRYMPYI